LKQRSPKELVKGTEELVKSVKVYFRTNWEGIKGKRDHSFKTGKGA